MQPETDSPWTLLVSVVTVVEFHSEVPYARQHKPRLLAKIRFLDHEVRLISKSGYNSKNVFLQVTSSAI